MALFGKLFKSAEMRDDSIAESDIKRSRHSESGASKMIAHEAPIDLLADIRSLNAAGKHAEALALVVAAQESILNDPVLHFARASILADWGRHREARIAYLQAETAGMSGSALDVALGLVHLHCGDPAAAEACVRRALALEPDDRGIRVDLSELLFNLGRHDEAATAIESALTSCPSDAKLLWLLGTCKIVQGDPQAAEHWLRLAIASDPSRAASWKDLGAALDAQGRLQEAIQASETAARLDQEHGVPGDSFVNLAIQLVSDGRTPEAIALHEELLPSRPYVHGHVAYALALLKSGRLREGWYQYESRALSGSALSVRQKFGRPTWSGQDLHGKAILLWAEQGLGDLIQFVRYAPMLKTLGATVLLRVADGLEAFAEGFPGIDRVLERGNVRADFDYYLNTMSLPHVFDTDLSSIPAKIPYIHMDPSIESLWAPRLHSEGKFRIGIVWAGNPRHAADRHRSMPLNTLAPLSTLPGTRFYALQKGSREEEARSPPAGFDIVDIGPELTDVRDTAAVIMQLDLIVTVDTAVAHLAGALGRPVWTLLPKVADWRWLEGRDDSPWYPTMRVFRQCRQGEWGGVIERVRSALDLVLKGEAPLLPQPHAAGQTGQRDVNTAISWRRDGRSLCAGFSTVAETKSGVLQYLPDESMEGKSLRYYGEVLQPQLDLLGQLVRTGATILEIGAGVGAHAIPLAAMAGSDGLLLLYEGQRVMRQRLRQNLVANRVGSVTLMRRMAAGSLGLDGDEVTRTVNATEVSPELQTETLDDLQLTRLDLVKANPGIIVADVIAGAENTIWRLRPIIFAAVHDDSALTDAADRLRVFGYRCWRMETAWFNRANFNRRDDDIFAGRTALAVVAVPEETGIDVARDGCVEII